MHLKAWRYFFACILIVVLTTSFASAAGERPDILFFYSETCPHCAAEQLFLDDIAQAFPALWMERLPISDPESAEFLKNILEVSGAERYIGVVPITIVGNSLFVGFDNADGVGAAIRQEVEQLALPNQSPTPFPSELSEPASTSRVVVPLIGSLDINRFSLPGTALILGLLDGFNICSLGALALILGLVLTLRDRRRIVVLGGAFLGTTAVVYGLLILFWYKAFSVLGALLGTLELVIGSLAFLGGIYFLWQFFKMMRSGPTCEFSGSSIIQRATRFLQERLQNPIGLLSAIFAVLLFAAVITIVEFPCSAAVPVVFAGILADAGLPAVSQFGIIILFLIAYLLDELIVFGIAVWGMRLWISSSRIYLWAVLAEALLLLGIGGWYLMNVL